ncbi:MAG: bifunctional demethylmenaquinone methyltransferase/2-methoxy-6-polyprenyl-1,4-benzoquinol methylase UbiE [Bacteroidia bacterium]|nr:bifunctional demethylmenaquinone methyltransferase/2-methoxy-6-polyprenyl-1,4-benzoquinol methylase UbiE [Bacteroidia bacterium]MCC7533505.1 bifunctional demethylmenaquinone methyltransferase/2-methoxy-6-polyprenyl-1,4-benzoquinol methylase UbiE [Bacteroidia bacterium]
MKEIKPYKQEDTSKREQVEQMFDSIAPRYDLLNRLLSMGIDQSWRKKAIASLKEVQPEYILDVATGTADLAIAALKINPIHVTGVDISSKMLAIGATKIEKKNLSNKISLIQADSSNLPFADNKFDAITVAFGVRNFEFLQKGIDEIHRVTKKGGKIAILEFSKPKSFPFKQIYYFYFNFILPAWGRIISKSQTAYTYLPESVEHFPEGNEFAKYLSNSGFTQINIKPLTFGICTLYTGIK